MKKGETMSYIALREGLNSKPRLIPANTKLESVIKNSNKDYYVSLYNYNEGHKTIFEDKKTLAGIEDTVTDRLFFDFDSKDNLEAAQADTITAANRLLEKGVPEEGINVYFSGSKGFSIEMKIDEYINPARFGAIVDSIGIDLNTMDPVVREANRIVRIPGTKHQSSGLYKIPLTPEELINLSVDEIKALAVKPRLIEANSTVVSLPPEMKNVKVVEKTVQAIKKEMTFDITTVDFKSRPKGLDEARYLLAEGFFRTGERNNAMLCLASTYKSQNNSEEVTRGVLKGVAVNQAQRTGEDIFPDNEIDLIIKQVYGPNWRGGTFTVNDPGNWLAKYALKMNIKVKEEQKPRTIGQIGGNFKHHIKHIKQNTFTTGIDSLDKVLPIIVGSNIGIVAAAGAGKTALSLQILKHNSEKGIPVLFASLDMASIRLFEKVLYNVTGLSREDLYEKFEKGEGDELIDMVKKQYKNVYFYDKAGATIGDIREYMREIERTEGVKIRLVLTDYFERLGSDISDATASSLKVANEIQDMVNEDGVASIVLTQPSKHALGGGPDTELKSYTAIKGSSFLYQSFRGIISLSRPFYSPETKENDNWAILNVLKNDLGEQDRIECGWSGKRGEFYDLEDGEKQELRELLKQKKSMEKGNDSGWQ